MDLRKLYIISLLRGGLLPSLKLLLSCPVSGEPLLGLSTLLNLYLFAIRGGVAPKEETSDGLRLLAILDRRWKRLRIGVESLDLGISLGQGAMSGVCLPLELDCRDRFLRIGVDTLDLGFRRAPMTGVRLPLELE